MSGTTSPLVALVGSPNSGKTALFNALTGSRQKVANYPGVTVERKEGVVRGREGHRIRVLDLPGAYSLKPAALDEQVTHDVLFEKVKSEKAPAAIVAVVDATSLERGLSLVLELQSVGRPMVLALNMMDLAEKRGLQLDLDILSSELGVPVVPTVAVKGQGLDRLVAQVEGLLEGGMIPVPNCGESGADQVSQRFNRVDAILKRAVRRQRGPAVWTDRIDRVLLHPVSGTLALLAVLGTMFQAIFAWAEPAMGWIETGVGFLASGVSSVLAEGALRSLIVDGIIAGVGSVLVFLPQILLLFLFILILESVGYMSRAAFLLDRMMSRVGLHGRAFIPLLSSFACAIPGILATRTIQNKRDRLATILVAPLMTCSARLPVYTLLIAAFIPNHAIAGFFGLQGLVMLGLYIAGILSGVVVAFVFKKSFLKGPTPPLLLELPTYKWPSWRNIVMGLYERARMFIKRAGTVIMSITVVLWFLASYPKPPVNATGPAINYSYAGVMGKGIEKVVQPLGFDWRIGIALVPGLAAREVMVGALATVYAVDEGSEEAVTENLGRIVAAQWTLPTALSLLVWYIFAPQCLATIAVARRETGSTKWAAVMLLYLLGLAYLGAWLCYSFFSWLGV